MPVTRAQKEAQLVELKEKMSKSQSLMFAQYIGLKVSEVGELRQKLKEANAEMKVAKKTLMRLAAKDAGLPGISEKNLEGPVACIFSFSDPLSGAQAAFKFAKDHAQVKLIGGIYDGKLLTKEEALEMARMPGRMELLAIFAAMIRSPLVSFAGACSSPLTDMARGLSELAKKKETSPAS
ncbi:MAG: 50S ribosomal protein L10 [Candidatus Peribacteraceae bacterium]|jgi:large subunit ribosomal protein L10|nr:50S ribosomal protein L10 [Candidatus Peribacteraceae bacterium]